MVLINPSVSSQAPGNDTWQRDHYRHVFFFLPFLETRLASLLFRTSRDRARLRSTSSVFM